MRIINGEIKKSENLCKIEIKNLREIINLRETELNNMKKQMADNVQLLEENKLKENQCIKSIKTLENYIHNKINEIENSLKVKVNKLDNLTLLLNKYYECFNSKSFDRENSVKYKEEITKIKDEFSFVSENYQKAINDLKIQEGVLETYKSESIKTQEILESQKEKTNSLENELIKQKEYLEEVEKLHKDNIQIL